MSYNLRSLPHRRRRSPRLLGRSFRLRIDTQPTICDDDVIITRVVPGVQNAVKIEQDLISEQTDMFNSQYVEFMCLLLKEKINDFHSLSSYDKSHEPGYFIKSGIKMILTELASFGQLVDLKNGEELAPQPIVQAELFIARYELGKKIYI